MAHQIRHLILTGLLTLGAVRLAAQSANQASVRFTVFAAHQISGLSFLEANGSAQPLKFTLSARSPRYTYTSAQPLKFIDAASGAVAAEAVIPPAIHDALLLFSDRPAGNARGLRYQVAIVDDGTTHLAPGHFTILNLSGLKFTGTFDSKDLVVNDGLNPPIPFAHAATLTLFTAARGANVQSYADTIKPPKGSRLLLIFFPPARKGALEVQSRALVDEPPSAAR